MEKRATDGIRKKDTHSSSLYSKPEDRIFIPHEDREHRLDAAEEQIVIIPSDEVARPPTAVFRETPRGTSSRSLRWGAGTGFLLCFLGFIAATTVFARLTVTVKPRVENLASQDIAVLLDTSVSRMLTQQKVIPAQMLEFSRTAAREFESTGTKFIEERSRGKVKVYNAFSSSPQRLVAETRFLTDRGMVYRLVEGVVIPGAKIEEGKIVPQFVGAELAADKAGEEGNASGEVKLNIPAFKGTAKYGVFYAVASSGFSGGFRGDARVVSSDDIKRAQEQVTKTVFDDLKTEIFRKIPSGFVLPDGLREIQIVGIDAPSVNTRRDRFSVSARASAQAMVFRERDIISFLQETFLNNDTTREIVEGSEEFVYLPRTVNLEKGRAEIAIQGNMKTKRTFSVDAMLREIEGKKEGTITEFLKGRSEFAAFELSFFPPWRFSAPKDPGKIRFIVEGQ